MAALGEIIGYYACMIRTVAAEIAEAEMHRRGIVATIKRKDDDTTIIKLEIGPKGSLGEWPND